MKRLQKTKNEKFVGLIRDIKENKPNALNSLLKEVQQTVHSFGMKVCGGAVEDAEDTTQETLLQFFKNAKILEFRNPRSLVVWLYKVAKNVCIMSRRKGKYEPKHTLSIEDAGYNESYDNLQNIALKDSSGDPENLVVKKENQHIIQEAMLTIPLNYRLVLVLRDMEQLTTKEVSDVLDITEQNVKVRLHRARMMMRKELLKQKSSIGEDAVINERN